MSLTALKNGQANEDKVKKRVVIGLLVGSLLIILSTVALAWWIVTERQLLINKFLLTIITAVMLLFFLLLGVGLFALIWSLWRSQELSSLQRIMSAATHVLFPFALRLGKIIGLDEDKIKNSYVQVSNQLVLTQTKQQPFQKVLVLAPHCLQWIHCPHKITINVYNCKRCGKCLIGDLIDLTQRLEADLVVVTGGTIARKIIKQMRPEAVVAIACERDLTSGLQDVTGLPVFGIVNERPEGPCANTRVDLGKVEEAVRFFRQQAGQERKDPASQT